jgi:hypothetical protein
MEDEEPHRHIEASLAQALAWGAPMWILDQDGPPPAPDRQAARASSMIRRIRSWVLAVAAGTRHAGRDEQRDWPA